MISRLAEAIHKKRGQISKLAGKRQNNLNFPPDFGGPHCAIKHVSTVWQHQQVTNDQKTKFSTSPNDLQFAKTGKVLQNKMLQYSRAVEFVS